MKKINLLLSLAFVLISGYTAHAQCTITGNLSFLSQTDLDNWVPPCSQITVTGSVNVQGATITDISKLQNIVQTGLFLQLRDISATSISALSNITSIASGGLTIRNCDGLTSIAPLAGITTFAGPLTIRDNALLTSLNGVQNLGTSVGAITIFNNTDLTDISAINYGPLSSLLEINTNPALTSLGTLSSITSITGKLNIRLNPALTNISGLSNLTNVGGNVEIISNNALTNISGLSALTIAGGGLFVRTNPLLPNLTGLDNLTSLGAGAALDVKDNVQLKNLCGLNDLVASGNFTTYVVTGNGYNPLVVDFPAACADPSLTTAIPDANFEQALIDALIDTDGVINGKIYTSDAAAKTGTLSLTNKGISDFTGIKAFTNVGLTQIDCNVNTMTSIDISGMTNITRFNCFDNPNLTTINVTGCTALDRFNCYNSNVTTITGMGGLNLTRLFCYQNPNLASLNVSTNVNLQQLLCYNTAIVSLDLSTNNKLTFVRCQNNPNLSYLNVKNGANNLIIAGPTTFVANNNPLLTCIDVDDVAYSTTSWPSIDSGTVFSLNCTTATTTWTGTTSTDWADASNWSAGVPTATSTISIPSVANNPIINTNVIARFLTIDTGATLTVNEGIILNNSGTITNNGDLILKSSATGTASLLNRSSSTNVTQQRYLSSNQRGWRLLSNPLTTTTFGALATNSTTPITLGANASGAYDSANNTWSNFTDANNMVSQQAYKVFLRGRTSEVTTTTYSTTPPSNVTLAIKGTATNTVPSAINTTASQYYLVANPYTAPVSLYSILGASTGLSNTVSYYSPTLGSSGSNADLILKYGGYTNTLITAATQGDANDVILPPMGAIFVQASSSGTINIPKTAIFTGTPLQAGTYNHKTAQTKVATSTTLKLAVMSGSTYYDVVNLQFKVVGDTGNNVDFGKLPNTILDFYSINGSANMAVSESELKDQIIPLGITSTVQKSYTLNVAENTIPAGFDAELIDNVLNTTTALTPGTDYNFTIDSTIDSQGNARFAINLKTAGTLSVTPNELDSKIKLWPNPARNQFNILNSNEGETSIEIISINGHMIHSQRLNSGTTSIPTKGWSAGVYILKATSNGVQTTKKLIIQ